MTPRGQHETAEAILQLARIHSTPFAVVLAGLSANPGDEQIHLASLQKIRPPS
ncbi:MAG: hypothetical protein Ct9H90mP16_09280 [Candidatus Poseidoniales archaeon]|nr:MAG: hypothetical protein Ct9H90mP16_09280 [Candidatus Poseidoniales archaeon]